MKLHKQVSLTLLAIASAMPASPAPAAIVASAQGVISQYKVFPEFGGGDVIFHFDGTLPSGCDGFWLRPTDAGFKQTFSTLVTAYTTKMPLYVWAHNDSIWTASSSNYCRVYMLNPL
jgi:hypothetical protein